MLRRLELCAHSARNATRRFNLSYTCTRSNFIKKKCRALHFALNSYFRAQIQFNGNKASRIERFISGLKVKSRTERAELK